MIKKKCPICHKTFYAKESDIARGWAKCCSKSCAAKLREKKHKKKAKATDEIIENIKDTCNILFFMKPKINIKDTSEPTEFWKK